MAQQLSSEVDDYLAATEFYDYEHPLVQEFVKSTLTGVPDNPVEQAKALYLASRDQIGYNPYVFSTDASTFRASYVLEHKRSYCIPKAILLGAAARAIGIPSRLGLADVKNHISSPQLIEWLRSDIFRMHGYIELFLEGKWVKATPAFDARLCSVMKVQPLEFNGLEDSIFQPFTENGEHHMEYINDYGQFEDVPHKLIIDTIKHHYPHFFEGDETQLPKRASLENDLNG